jgi:transcriptional regulator with GAF, ATPase, and Fis domain
MNAVVWTPGMKLDTLVEQVIHEALRFYKGNKTQTANALGIATRTLDNRMEKYEAQRLEREKLAEEAQKARERWLQRQMATPAGANVSPLSPLR